MSVGEGMVEECGGRDGLGVWGRGWSRSIGTGGTGIWGRVVQGRVEEERSIQ